MLKSGNIFIGKCKPHTSKVPIGINDVNIEQKLTSSNNPVEEKPIKHFIGYLNHFDDDRVFTYYFNQIKQINRMFQNIKVSVIYA